MPFPFSFNQFVDFCRSDLFFALLGGFAIGSALVASGAMSGEAELPMAAPVSLVSSAG